MIFLDGLETFSFASTLSAEAMADLRSKAYAYLDDICPLGDQRSFLFDATVSSDVDNVYSGAFAVRKGPYGTVSTLFSLEAPTTLDNVRRLVRACQLSKPILLEGSPGVGKTSLVVALGSLTGHRVCRINLSDQTDLADLFGSDLPVEGGEAGEFAWKDAAFLEAMQRGDWVLLDEMNLAPQAVLEGLNAVLDHRGTVFIPELCRSFTKHPRFQIFAAQNPLHQGGGRKGLPKSFLDRFIKVHVRPLNFDDILVICKNQFPTFPDKELRSMIQFNTRLQNEVVLNNSFGREGGPWEFNLRDIIRWATLSMSDPRQILSSHPAEYIDTLYTERFRSKDDRQRVRDLFNSSFPDVDIDDVTRSSQWTATRPYYVQLGSSIISRGSHVSRYIAVELQSRLNALSAASICLQQGWLLILSGSTGVGKTSLVYHLACETGQRLREVSISSGTDTTDILGSFEQTINSETNAVHFEWVDGPLVQAIKEGYWILLNNSNLCSPSILDRLNSLCEMGGSLVLTERGHVNGEVQVLKPHPHFRLILTVDPRHGELSRAMRNRGVEIHMLEGSIGIQDALRLLDAARIPTCVDHDVSMDTVRNAAFDFELARRGSRRHVSSLDYSPVVRSQLSGYDSSSSELLDLLTLRDFVARTDIFPFSLAVFRMLTLSNVRNFTREITSSNPLWSLIEKDWGCRNPFLDSEEIPHIISFREILGSALAQAGGLSSTFMLSQVCPEHSFRELSLK